MASRNCLIVYRVFQTEIPEVLKFPVLLITCPHPRPASRALRSVEEDRTPLFHNKCAITGSFTLNSLLPIKISLLGILCSLITRVGNLQLKSAEMLAFTRQKYLFLSEFLTISLYFPCYAANSILAETASKKHGKVSQIPLRFACQNWFGRKFYPHVRRLRGERALRELCWG